MSRIRYLKPSFFLDEDISTLPHWIRLLYQGLWVIADKDGILEDRPKRIKAEIFPYEDCDIESGLTALAALKRNKRSFIVRYSVNEEHYIQILKWKDHQKPHHTEKDSVFPPHPLKDKDKDKDKDKPAQRELEVKQPLFNGEETVKSHKHSNNKVFELFWNTYPKKMSKAHAERAWTRIKPDNQLAGLILAALEGAKKSENWQKDNGQFIPYPATWLNARGWEDQFETKKEKEIPWHPLAKKT